MGVAFEAAVYELAIYKIAATKRATLKRAAFEFRSQEEGLIEVRIVPTAIAKGTVEEAGRYLSAHLTFEIAHFFERAKAKDMFARVRLEKMTIEFGQQQFFDQEILHSNFPDSEEAHSPRQARGAVRSATSMSDRETSVPLL